MASIACDAKGYRRIQFMHPDGRRPTIRLGKVSQRTASSTVLSNYSNRSSTNIPRMGTLPDRSHRWSRLWPGNWLRLA